MESIKLAIRHMALNEYHRASKTFGEFHHSDHEAYAVILEELQEAEEELTALTYFVEAFWRNVKSNRDTRPIAEDIMKIAINTAAELVQVAAMAYKSMQGGTGDKGDRTDESYAELVQVAAMAYKSMQGWTGDKGDRTDES